MINDTLFSFYNVCFDKQEYIVAGISETVPSCGITRKVLRWLNCKPSRIYRNTDLNPGEAQPCCYVTEMW